MTLLGHFNPFHDSGEGITDLLEAVPYLGLSPVPAKAFSDPLAETIIRSVSLGKKRDSNEAIAKRSNNS
jgi:hypothetical protein